MRFPSPRATYETYSSASRGSFLAQRRLHRSSITAGPQDQHVAARDLENWLRAPSRRQPGRSGGRQHLLDEYGAARRTLDLGRALPLDRIITGLLGKPLIGQPVSEVIGEPLRVKPIYRRSCGMLKQVTDIVFARRPPAGRRTWTTVGRRTLTNRHRTPSAPPPPPPPARSGGPRVGPNHSASVLPSAARCMLTRTPRGSRRVYAGRDGRYQRIWAVFSPIARRQPRCSSDACDRSEPGKGAPKMTRLRACGSWRKEPCS